MSDLEPAVLFDVLSNARRQHVIRELDSGAKSVGALAESRAREEYDIPADEAVTGKKRKRVYIGLYQTHLSQLDELDVVNWTKDAGAVTPGPNHQKALRVLESVTGEQTDPSVVDRLRGIAGGVRG